MTKTRQMRALKIHLENVTNVLFANQLPLEIVIIWRRLNIRMDGTEETNVASSVEKEEIIKCFSICQGHQGAL